MLICGVMRAALVLMAIEMSVNNARYASDSAPMIERRAMYETSIPRAHFEHAGLAFDYPAGMSVSLDDDAPRWVLTHGDFMLHVGAPSYAAGSENFLSLFLIGSDNSTLDILADAQVTWCGRKISPIHWRITIERYRHDLKAYDLPSPESEARFLVFDDILVDGRPSPIAEATLAAIAATLRCSSGK